MSARTVVITGASRGLGRAMALAFAASRDNIVINYQNNKEAALKTVQDVKALGGDAIAVKASVNHYSEAKALIDKALARYGRLDVLINNAGVKRDGAMRDVNEEAYDTVMDVNVKAAWNTVKHASDTMIKAGSGRIINISSGTGLQGRANQANYSAAKAAIIGMTKSLAKELGPFGITVNAVAPGLVETDMTDYVDAATKAAYIESVPLKRLGTPEDIAGAVRFFASNDASFINGQVLAVNGGLH